jgi:hypothetical protein
MRRGLAGAFATKTRNVMGIHPNIGIQPNMGYPTSHVVETKELEFSVPEGP